MLKITKDDVQYATYKFYGVELDMDAMAMVMVWIMGEQSSACGYYIKTRVFASELNKRGTTTTMRRRLRIAADKVTREFDLAAIVAEQCPQFGERLDEFKTLSMVENGLWYKTINEAVPASRRGR